MDFAVVEWAERPFKDLCAQLRNEPIVAPQVVAASWVTQLRVEAGPLVVVAPGIAVVHTTWRDRIGRIRIEAEIRLVGINRGKEPLTELLMIGHGPASGRNRPEVLAWAHRVLTELADHRQRAIVA